MAWLCSTAIRGTVGTDRGNASPRFCVGALAPAALYHQRNAAIWDSVHTVRSGVGSVVDGDDANHDAHPGQRSSGNALPCIWKRVCVHDVGARCAAIRAGTLDHSS
jgi:hypothetical protein